MAGRGNESNIFDRVLITTLKNERSEGVREIINTGR